MQFAERLWNFTRPLMHRLLPYRWDQKLVQWRNRRLPRTRRAGGKQVVLSLRPCDEMECIFVHIPKAAGMSVSKALFGCEVGLKTVSDYQRIFAEDFWKYFKFTVVRNPFTRVVSAYEFLKRGGHPAWPDDQRYCEEVLSEYSGFDDFVLEELGRAAEKQVHFRPQANFLTLDGELAVNYVAKLETLETDFEVICERLDVERELLHKNETGDDRPSLTSYYEHENVADTVRSLYADDFSLLNYSRQLPS